MDEYQPTSAFNFEPEDIVESEVIEHPTPNNDRSAARRVALQVLYEIDSTGHPVGDVLNWQVADQKLTDKALGYLRQLVAGVMENKARLDRTIQRFAPEFPLNQVAIIDRNILRMAIFEFAINTRTPVSVAIDEAVELGKLFGSESTPRFVNGVLGSMADDPAVLDQLLNAENPENLS
ncbi:MAG: transcription antitermination factor NusB [bacterium]|nr:transcription antitermination factor NusB [bacterium]